jgi:hypothetical protein
MSEAELIFTALAELSTRQIAESDQAEGLPANANAGKKGGSVAAMHVMNWNQKPEKVSLPAKIFCRRAKRRS